MRKLKWIWPFGFGLWVLAAQLSLPAATASPAHPLDTLRQNGAIIPPGVRDVPGRKGTALAFSNAGIELPMGQQLTAGAGSVALWVQTPAAWPSANDCTLFHVGEESHVHVTLFVRAGALLAVYKSDADHYASVRFAPSISWKTGTWHLLEYSWETKKNPNEIEFFLRVDGEIAGVSGGAKIQRWPQRFYLGARGRTQSPWPGLIEDAQFKPTPLPLVHAQPGNREIEIHANQTLGDCYNFWSIHNYTSEDMFADPSQRKINAARHPYMKYVNCVRFMGGRDDGKNEYFLGLDPQGKPRYDFAPAIAYIKGMLEWGYTPRLVLDNVPTKMSNPAKMNTYGNTYPPKDFEVYHAYIQAFVQKLVAEFGAGTVGRWRFRVMTEPDLLPGHWAGTKEEWLRLYDTAVDAVTRVLPDADIGPGNILNPAGGESSRGNKWGLDIIDHAATGKNYYTGKTGTRMGYFSCSWYGGVGKPLDEFESAINTMRARLAKYPQFKNLPVEVAEFGVLHDENSHILSSGEATEWTGSWLAAIADRAWRLNVRQIHQWSVNAALLPSPYTHLLWMLEQMSGGQRLAVTTVSNSTTAPQTSGATKVECGAIACQKDGRLLVLLYNHCALRTPEIPQHLTLRLHDARFKAGAAWKLSEWSCDATHGVFMRTLYDDIAAAGIKPLPNAGLWGADYTRRFGEPARAVFTKNKTRYEQLAQLPQTRKAEPLQTANGEATLTLDLPGHSVRFIELRPE